MGQYPSTVNITNKFNRQIKVRVDCSRSFVKCSQIEQCVKAPLGSILVKKSEECNAAHIVDTSTSFTIIDGMCDFDFSLPAENNDKFAFLTVWVKNDDGSWSIFCENHQITRQSNIQIKENIYVSHYYGNPNYYKNAQEEYGKGRVVVFNKSSRNVWIRLDADNIETTKTELSCAFSAKEEKIDQNVSAKIDRKVYYRVKQGVGYTLVRNCGENNDFTVFYMNVPRNIVYTSIDYETNGGELESICLNHPITYNPDILANIPHIYVEDSGEHVKFRWEHELQYF